MTKKFNYRKAFDVLMDVKASDRCSDPLNLNYTLNHQIGGERLLQLGRLIFASAMSILMIPI